MTASDFQATVRAQLQALDAAGLAPTLVARPRSTVIPPQEGDLTGARALRTLLHLERAPLNLEDLGPLGAGGMGEVRLATQVALNRKVAVKSLRPERRARQDVEALLGEAWLAGALEHPNVVPVHDLGLDAEGLPVLVMKHIEGETWARLLHDAAAMARHAPGRAPLEEHLRILVQVCNAVHFAHARGVVHRDVKPSNVMVGHFGEVYLVDWGIATAVGPSRQLAGTPAYLAPEMLGGEGAVLSARTDVYLLGAVLFEVLAGAPPHDASTPEGMVVSVLSAPRALPQGTPAELEALARACLQPDAAQRPESALAVRRALEDFLEHQGSLQLAAQARARVPALLALLAAGASDSTQLDSLFAECRFGFQQALRTWPGNVDAREGLTQAVEAMLRHALARGAPQAALSLLHELPQPNAALEAQVRAALEEEQERGRQLARLKELERTLDPRTDGRLRVGLGLALSAVWTLTPLVGKFLVAQDSRWEMLGAVPVSLLTGVAVLLLGRAKQHTPLNLSLQRIILFGMLGEAFLLCSYRVLVGDLGANTLPLVALFWWTICSLVALAFERRLSATAAAFLLALLAMLAWPAQRFEAICAANLVLSGNMLYLWWKLPRG